MEENKAPEVKVEQVSQEDFAEMQKGLEGLDEWGTGGELELSDEDLDELAERCLVFCEAVGGRKLFGYQKVFAFRVIRSVLCEDSDTLTALFARQSGKTETVAVIICGLMVILPLLASIITDERIQKFKEGFLVGVFAPNYDIGGIMYGRMLSKMHSKASREIMSDPEIGMYPEEIKQLILPNGSRCELSTTSPNVEIEGKTYHLIICEECQSISARKLNNSINPMGAATAATMLYIGTPSPEKSEFYLQCERNRRVDLKTGDVRRKKVHFKVTWQEPAKANPRYAKYIEKQKEKFGEHSDTFRMKYNCEFLLSRGQFLTIDMVESNGVDKHIILKGIDERGFAKRFILSPGVVTNDHSSMQIAAIDFGRSDSSTVVTIGRPWWDIKFQYGEETRFHIHVQNWLELEGDDHEAQYPQVMDFLKNFRLKAVIVDATGKGDPIYSRMKPDLAKSGIATIPFVFGTETKDAGYKLLLSEWQNNRVTFPMSKHALRQRKVKRFIEQLSDLRKEWRGPILFVSKDKKDSNARDDYPDSLMMMVSYVNGKETMVEPIQYDYNPFFDATSRRARWLTNNSKGMKIARSKFHQAKRNRL